MYFKIRLRLWSARRSKKKLEIISKFPKISFDRHLFDDQNNFVSIELHGYCDAFKTAYSAVIYVRTIYEDKMTVKFASAKPKVVSNKGVSIPRIELLPCLLLSKLVSTLCQLKLLLVKPLDWLVSRLVVDQKSW